MPQRPKTDPVDRPEVAGAAIVGARSEQQDRYHFSWIQEDLAWLLVIADGMGGHEGGAVASKIAVDAFSAGFFARRKRGLAVPECLEASLDAANLLLAEAQNDNLHLSSMGTTLVAVYLSRNGVSWISVGDSPLWLVRGGKILQLNDDHSLRGVGGAASRNANMLQSALVGKEIPLIDKQFEPVSLEAKDVLVLSSDGLLTLPEEIIATVATKHAPGSQMIADALIDAVQNEGRSNQDNCTVVVATNLNSQVVTQFGMQKLKLTLAVLLATAAIAGIVYLQLVR